MNKEKQSGLDKGPEINFLVDSDNDFRIAKMFLYDTKDEFRDNFFREIPGLFDPKLNDEDRESLIKAHIEKNYSEKSEVIKRRTKEISEEWGKTAPDYYKMISLIFDKHAWPEGEYKAYPSIFWMFPRFIDKKEFTFPYVHRIPRYPIQTIGHEMLHFIFFDYIKKHFNLTEDSGMHSDPQYVWRVSEVFNDVIEEWAPYEEVTQIKEHHKPYPGCEDIYKKMKAIWTLEPNAFKMLQEMFKE